jgi:predicted peptidase
VPSKYTGASRTPLIVALHGLGGNEDGMVDNYGKRLPALAEQYGYIVASPLGYRVDGGYGYGVGAAPADPVARRRTELSEADVMAVVDLMKKHYKIDENRIYLMGHSMGAIGTWRLAAKYPDVWRRSACSRARAPATVERMKHIPQIVVHGDADPTVSVQGSRAMVAELKRLGVEHSIEVPRGDTATSSSRTSRRWCSSSRRIERRRPRRHHSAEPSTHVAQGFSVPCFRSARLWPCAGKRAPE